MPALPLSEIPLLLNPFLASICEAGGVPVLWPGVDESPRPGLWVKPTLKMGAGVSGGEKGRHGLSRRAGVFLVDIYTPPPLVEQDALEFADKVEKAFRREDIGGITIEDPTTAGIGEDKAVACPVVRVTIPFWCWAGK